MDQKSDAQSRYGRSRNGITLVELLFVIAIATISFLFLSKWSLGSRTNAQGAQCVNNLKQLVLASANYESRWGYFPPGMTWSLRPGNAFDESSLVTGAGPLVALLSDLTHQNVYNAANFDYPIHSPVNTTVCGWGSNTFYCPSDPLIQLHSKVDNQLLQGNKGSGTHLVAKSSYAGIAGPWVVNTWKIPGVGQGERSSFPEAHRNQLGMFNVHSQVRLAEVTDGTSNTLIFGERSSAVLSANSRDTSFWWFSGNHGDSLMTTMFPIIGPDVDYPSEIAPFTPSSGHEKGPKFAFVDGSVRFVKAAANPLPVRAIPVPSRTVPHIQGFMSPDLEAVSIGPDPFWDTIFRPRSHARFTILQRLSTRAGDDVVAGSDY